MLKTYQIKIALKHSKPRIWRRVLVPADLLLPDFHAVIQIAMGWTNSHLHQFAKDRIYYTEKMEEDDFWGGANTVDYSQMTISDLLTKEKDRMIYEYDFGDSWEHEIILEKVKDKTGKDDVLTCLTGKNNCPPEDCGGIWGYYSMLEILKDPKHEEYEDYIGWLGEDFDPTEFDINDVNDMLNS